MRRRPAPSPGLASAPGPPALVGVVAIVYRQSDDELADFLGSIESLSHPDRLVYLVNNEEGRDLAWLAIRYGPGLSILDGRGNRGFTGGANVGIGAALRSGCDRILLLNTDITILRSDLIERLGDAFAQDGSCAMVSPVMVQAPRTDLIWYQGAVIGRWSWIPRHPGINHAYRRPKARVPTRTSVVCGCCVLIDRRTIERLGGLDEDLFSYFDDADLSRRATDAGMHLYVWPEALLAHHKDGRRLSAIETYYFGRNPFVLIRKHARPLTWPIAALAQICVALPATLARAATPQARREAWRGMLHGLQVLVTGTPTGKGHREGLLKRPEEPSRLEVDQCDLCGAGDAVAVMDTHDRLFGLPGTFALLRCASCGLVRLSPRPSAEDLASYYPEGDYYAYAPRAGVPRYQRAIQAALDPLRTSLRATALAALSYPEFPGTGPTAGAGRAAPRPPIARRLTGAALRRSLLMQRIAGYPWEIPRYVPGGRALDVGCGNGRYLASLAELGWEVAGVDPSPAAAAAALAVHDIAIHVGTIESAPFGPASFDFIHMGHVVEHLDQPVQSLSRAFELLRPGGWLYVETPNLDSYPAKLLGRHWFNLDSPRHLWLFDVSTLSDALGATGFELETLWTYVTIRCFSWASTYRREEDLGRMLRWRPSVGARDIRLSLAHGLTARARVHLQPNSGDIVACWARKPPGEDRPETRPDTPGLPTAR